MKKRNKYNIRLRQSIRKWILLPNVIFLFLACENRREIREQIPSEIESKFCNTIDSLIDVDINARYAYDMLTTEYYLLPDSIMNKNKVEVNNCDTLFQYLNRRKIPDEITMSYLLFHLGEPLLYDKKSSYLRVIKLSSFGNSKLISIEELNEKGTKRIVDFTTNNKNLTKLNVLYSTNQTTDSIFLDHIDFSCLNTIPSNDTLLVFDGAMYFFEIKKDLEYHFFTTKRLHENKCILELIQKLNIADELFLH